MKEVDLLKIVAQDLRHLREVARSATSDEEVRRLSATMRFLLTVDGHCNVLRAWTTMGLEPIRPRVLSNTFSNIGLGREDLVLLGAQIRGFKISQFEAAGSRRHSTEETKAATKTGASEQEQAATMLSLPKFLDAKVGWVRGQNLSRAHLINYVANRRGGTHFALAADKKALFNDLDAVPDHQILGVRSIELALLGVAQAIASSADLMKLEQTIFESVS